MADRYQEEWDEIWARKSIAARTIDFGRIIYNWFFRRVLSKYLNPKSTMLEVGCGTSTLSLSLAPAIHSLVGVDISGEALARSQKEVQQKKVSNAKFVFGDCRNLSSSQAFDFVWSQGLLEHFPDPEAIAREHYKVLSKGGVALMSVPYRYSYHNVWYKLTRPKILRRFWPWTEQRFFTKKELLKIGKNITPRARVLFLHPVPLGIVMLELTK